MTILRSLHWTRRHVRGYRAARRCVMLDNSVLAGEVLRHGAYVCLRLADGADARAVAGAAIPALAEKLGLQNEFAPAAGPPSQSIAFLRRHGATPGALSDDGVAQADAVVHVAAPTASPVSDFCAEATRLLGEGLDGAPHVLPAALRRRGPDEERGPRAGVGRRDPVPAAAHLQEHVGAGAGGRVRLRHLLRVRRRRRAHLPPGLCQPPGRRAESGVEVRAGGTDVARPACRDLVGSLLERAVTCRARTVSDTVAPPTD